jgi:hypothetical protein
MLARSAARRHRARGSSRAQATVTRRKFSRSLGQATTKPDTVARTISSYCGQSLKSMIPIMIIEPTATTTEQINGNSSSTATTPARPLRVRFICAKRQPATPIRKLRLAPSSSGLTLSTQSARLTIANSGVPLDQGEETLHPYCQGERCFCVAHHAMDDRVSSRIERTP